MSPEEANSGTGGSSTTAGGTEAVATASAAGTLPFTGSRLPVVVVIGLGLLGLGVGLRRVATES